MEPRIAFRLSQLGAAVSERWGARLAEVGLTPSEGLVLLTIAGGGGASQRELADRLGIVASRVVAILDGLEGKGLVQRSRSAVDRRRQELALTDAGTRMRDRLRAAGREHENEILAPLDEADRAALARILATLARGHGLGGGHPGAGAAEPPVSS